MSKLRAQHPILYCLLAAVLAIGFYWLFGKFTTVLANAGVLPGSDAENPWITQVIDELALAAAGVALLASTHMLGLVRHKASNVLHGLVCGMPVLVFSLLATGVSAWRCIEDGATAPAAGIIVTFVVFNLLVGVAEEFLARGVIAQTLLDHFGLTHGGILRACVLAGVFFGCMHLYNLQSAEAAGVLIQVAGAAMAGMLYAAVYFRCGTIWAPVLLHGLWDLAGTTRTLFGLTTVSSTISAANPAALIAPAVLAAIALFLVRSKKVPEIQQAWEGVIKEKPAA